MNSFIRKVCVIFFLLVSTSLFAKPQSFIRDYTYQASEADSKISCRNLALEEVKKLLLAELGTHISHELNATRHQDGSSYADESITAITAGIARVDIIDEKWNGITYFIKAKIEADPDEVLESVKDAQQRNDYKKRFEDIKYRKSVVEKEMSRLREELVKVKNDKKLSEESAREKVKSLQSEYQSNTGKVTAINLYLDGLKKDYQANDDEACYLFRRAADLEYGAALKKLSECYTYGTGFKKNKEKGIYFQVKAWGSLKKEALLGDRNSQFELAELLDYDSYPTKQELDKFNISTADIETMSWKIYTSEAPVKLDMPEYWYQKAASNGHLESMLTMAIKWKDEIKKSNKEKSDYWAKKLYEQVFEKARTGDAGACYYMGELTYEGLYVHKDIKESARYHRCAGNDWSSIDRLMHIYSGRAGKEYASLEQLKSLQVEGLHATTKYYSLGKLYQGGIGGAKRDVTKAIQYYRKALVKNGHVCFEAANALVGLGVKPSTRCF